jgi:hypothetical protein
MFSFLVFMLSKSAVLKCKRRREGGGAREGRRVHRFDFTYVAKFSEEN